MTYALLPDFDPGSTTEEEDKETLVTSPAHYINVLPRITLRKQTLPLDSLSIFSVISKFMGSYPDTWDEHLRGISERGYNAVHFTPLLVRGASNSPYSLFDQMKFDPEFFANGERDVQALVEQMESEYGLLSVTDVVWNHTAHNSAWLLEHPEGGYNVATAPWLEAALEMDDALLAYGESLERLGLPVEIEGEADLVKVVSGMRKNVIDKVRLWEFYPIDVKTNAKYILDAWKEGDVSIPKGGFWDLGDEGLTKIKAWSLKEKAAFLREKALLNGDCILGRYSRTLQPDIAAALLTALYGAYSDSADLPAAEADLIKLLDEVNLPLFQSFDTDVADLLDQLYNRIKYLRLDAHGPKLGPITKDNPLIETYFTRLPLNETTKPYASKHGPKALSLVNNGWVWDADAMRDHAGRESRAYLRREVIIWGDCVKLRYGNSPSDNPFLWSYMADYTRLMAKHFVGFRIDNCHSTPLWVAEYLLDEARRVRPDLVVVAELFTGSEATDYVFAMRLGLTCLIREAMQAWSTAELSRLVHRHGGRPIGSFDIDLMGLSQGGEGDEVVRHVAPATVHALLMDCTHDNEMPAQKRDARDTLANTALVSMCASATGSVFGYDEVYPRHVNLVSEKRQYASREQGGIGPVMKTLNGLHTRMAVDGYDETHIHHDGEYITEHRVQPDTRRGVLLIARTAFGEAGQRTLDPVYLTGTKAKLVGGWRLEVDSSEEAREKVDKDENYLRGLPSQLVALEDPNIEEKGNDTIVSIPAGFPPGSIALFETWIPESALSEGLSEFITSGTDKAFSSLDLIDLNFVLYRCEAEERDSTHGQSGLYNIPNFGPLVYAGLQGWWSVLEQIVRNNDLAHPLCDNLRNGQWALDYIVERMQRAQSEQGYERLRDATEWLRSRFDAVRKLPSFLLPRYFAIIVRTAYNASWRRGVQLLGLNVATGQHFIHELSMVSVQMLGYVKSASLYPGKQVPCLAAGLPHFSTDWARCWGRDVFISLRGLLLCTGRYDDAREHILAFASVLKHGMIPNLLSSGREPRYNSRDSVWFFLQAVQDYADIAPDGIKVLKEDVRRRFLPYDDTWFSADDPRAYSTSSTIEEIIQEIFQRHASGLSFREHNAGPQLDMQMSDKGFQIDISVDWDTGIVYGGNQWNCGTWMDKMGESERAGNKGAPGTPRDGAAVEITGLLYSALRWVGALHKEGMYKESGVDTGKGRVNWEDWAGRIKKNFERCYYVPVDSAQDKEHDVDPNIVNRRGIYKDLHRSATPFADYQLRPNFCIAMTVAPDLFNPQHALHALSVADATLRFEKSIGLATLDPGDVNYRPWYNNSEDSESFETSKGRNYHQGPEWVWPLGYFLRAMLRFCREGKGNGDIFHHLSKRMGNCVDALRESPWRGLTELTNREGEECADSVSFLFFLGYRDCTAANCVRCPKSPTQAWSAACLLDLYWDAERIVRETEQ